MYLTTTSAPTDQLFLAVADPTRRSILKILSKKPRTVSELLKPFDMSQPAVSQHLKILRNARLVQVKDIGRFRYYELNAASLLPVFDWVQYFEKFWDEKLDNLGKYLSSHKNSKLKKREN